MSIIVNQRPIETFVFAGGECHIKIEPASIGDHTAVLACLNNSDDIMRLLLTIDAIRRVNPTTVIDLTIPYFPYARQDRVCNEGESLSVKVMADLINGLHCNRLTIYDPHSDVTSALLDHCHNLTMADIIAGTPLAQEIKQQQWALISPDAGAEKKTRAVAKRLSTPDSQLEVFCARKTRETLTGEITATEVYGDVHAKSVLIVDDICDGGKTFIELAKALKEQGAKEIYLYVTHGLFSKGLPLLKDHFKRVYCYHTMLGSQEVDSAFLQVLGTLS